VKIQEACAGHAGQTDAPPVLKNRVSFRRTPFRCSAPFQCDRDRLVVLKKAQKYLITQKQAAEELGKNRVSLNLPLFQT
jgi:hypothetical protein